MSRLSLGSECSSFAVRKSVAGNSRVTQYSTLEVVIAGLALEQRRDSCKSLSPFPSQFPRYVKLDNKVVEKAEMSLQPCGSVR